MYFMDIQWVFRIVLFARVNIRLMFLFPGIGLDSGHMFTAFRGDSFHTNKDLQPAWEERDADVMAIRSCEFSRMKEMVLKGKCTFYHACKAGREVFFESDCKYRTENQEGSCEVVRKEFVTIQGMCMTGGYCRDINHPCENADCHDTHNQYNHEACVQRDERRQIENMELKIEDPRKESLMLKAKDEVPDTLNKCKGIYNPKLFTRLSRMCTDCYNMYREVEVYTECTSNCFATPTFFGCAKALLINEDEAKTLADELGK